MKQLRVTLFVYLKGLIGLIGFVSDEISSRFEELVWLLQTWITCGVGEMSVSQKGTKSRCSGSPCSILWFWNLTVENKGHFKITGTRLDIFESFYAYFETTEWVALRFDSRHTVNIDESLNEVANLHQLKYLVHVLNILNYHIPRCAMLADVGLGLEKARGGRNKTYVSVHEVTESSVEPCW